jgi:predicted neutral ceramidase superfamily lipid hydrolase
MTFFQGMFSSDSSASYGRFSSFLALVCLLIWSSLLVSKTGIIPAVPETWLLLVCIPFGITKAADVMTAKKPDAIPPAQ